MAKNTERVIRISVDATKAKQGTEKISRGLKKIETQGKKTNASLASMTSSINIFRTAASALVVGTGLSAIAKMADSYTNLNSRIKLVTKTTEEHAVVLNGLDAIASVTFSSLEANAQLYNRISTSMEHYNITAEQTLAITEGVAHTFRISGATAQESASGLIQFSQGLAAGRFQGDELRNILEGNISMQRIFAKAMGTTTAELKKLGAEGKITAAKVLPELIRSMEALRKQSAKVAPTISAGFQILTNKATLFIGKVNEATNASKSLGKVLEVVSRNLQVVALLIGAIAGAAILGALFIGMFKLIAILKAATVASRIMWASMTLGMSLAVVGIVKLYRGFDALEEGIRIATGNITVMFHKIAKGFNTARNMIKKGWGGALDAEDLAETAKIDASLARAQKDLVTTEIMYLKAVREFENRNKNGLVDVDSVSFKKQLEELKKAMGGMGKGVKVKTEKDPMSDRLKSLQDELEMMGRITRESKIQGEIINMTREKKKNATKDDLVSLAKQIDAKKHLLALDKTLIDFNKDIASSQDDIGKAYQKGQEGLSKYNELLTLGKISQEQFNIAQAIYMADYNTLVADMTIKTQELTGFVKELHGAMDGFSQSSAEGLVNMSELLFQSGKGWQDFGDIVKDVIKGIARDIAVMGTKEFVTNPLFDMLKGSVAGMQSGDGGGSTYIGDAVQMGLTGLTSSAAPSAAPAPSLRPNINARARVNVVNVIDPAVVGEYLNTKDGEDTMVNVLSNSDSYKAI